VIDDETVSRRARWLAATIEPFVGQVYFSPECHAEYVALGFGPSPRTVANGVQLPDGPAYFCSRGSALGQVPGEVVAAAFAVFNPAVVVPAVAAGWALTDAATIAAARARGATAQLVRIGGPSPAGLARAIELLRWATEPLRVEGRPLYAGVRSLGLPGDPVGDAWRLADLLREFRGDAHIAAWTTAGFDAVEIGLLTELYWRLPMRSYIRSRAWSSEQLDEAQERLRSRGLLDGDGFSERGRAEREAVEVATDRQVRPAIEALGDDLDELVGIVAPWSTAIREACGYLPMGPHELAGGR
jgi:Helix-turn-helix family